MPPYDGPPPAESPRIIGAHRLPDEALAALAAGRPDAATVAELRRAVLSRHLLMLREIVRAAPTTTRRGYAELAAAERHAPTAVRDVLGQPLVGVWAAGCLSALSAGASPAAAGAAHLETLAATATARARLPTAGATHSRPGTERAGPAGGGDGHPTVGASRRLTAEHAGLRVDVLLEDVDPLRARLGLTPTGRLDEAQVAHWAGTLRAAWRLLVTRHPQYARVIGSVLTCIVPVEADASARGISATSADAYGAVAMSVPADAAALAVGLLHETQHSLLNVVQYLFDLHVRPAQLRYSPWRDDPRPASGLLHGAYAYLGVADFWRVERLGGDPVAAFEFARWRATVVAAAGDLLDGSGLTPVGRRFVEAMRERALPWLDEPVDPVVLRLAEGANTDHRLRWRLRNLTVDPAAVAALADAWRRDVPPPAELPSALIRPAAGRELESNRRLELIHRLLRRPDAAGVEGEDAGEPGDDAYLRGDSAVASAAYRRRVGVEPDDLAAWAGLGLTSDQAALRERPEVVAALHRAIVPHPDPLAVASWLTSGEEILRSARPEPMG